MKALIIILLGLFSSWHFIDLHSKSFLHSAIAPLLFFLFLVAFVVWIASKVSSDSRSGSSDSGSGWSSDDFGDSGGSDAGSDGGGGD